MNIKRTTYKEIEQYQHFRSKSLKFKEDFFGASPSPFIGRIGYPNVNVGIMAPQKSEADPAFHDAPKIWSRKLTPIPIIASLRYHLVNSRVKGHVKKIDKIVNIAQEVAMARKPVDIEFHLKKKPIMNPLRDNTVTLMGPNASIDWIRSTENVRIPKKIDKVSSDTDLKAGTAIEYLHKHGFEENDMSKILSVGSLGLRKNRKLVPTRWSITAVDNTIGKKLITKLKDYSIGDCEAYFGGHYGNYFLVLITDNVWGYELFELYMPKTGINKSTDLQYTTDHEFYEGRKTYANNTAGGYYASRLPILENLIERKRQGRVIVIRFITDEYKIPLGVWVVREAVKKTMKNKIRFTDQKLLLDYAKAKAKKSFNFQLDWIFKESKLLKEQKQQAKLNKFF